MKHLFLIIAIFFIYQIGSAQPQGRFSVGLSSGVNENKTITPNGKFHTGYFVSLEGALTKSSVSPMISFQYHKRNILANQNRFFPEDGVKMDFVKFRGGVNLVFFKWEKVKLRGKALYAGNVIFTLDDKLIEQRGNGPMNELNPSWVAGIGADVYGVSVDVEYEKGTSNGYMEVDNSKFSTIYLSLGICF